MARIAVEEGLNDVKNALKQSGHEVVSMDQASSCECCVITGQDQNVMGMADIEIPVSVINARGMSTEEIVQQVNQRLG